MNGAALFALFVLGPVVTGCAGFAYVRCMSRTPMLRRSAHGRFILWFAVLVVAAAAGPLAYAACSARQANAVAVRIPAARPVHRIADARTVLGPAAFVRATAVATPAPPAPVAASARRIDPLTVALALWLFGASIGMVRIVSGLWALRRIIERSEPVETRATSRGNVRIALAGAFGVPVATGFLRPVVLLPRAIFVNESAGDLENIVLHELHHLSRYDDVTALLQAFCVALMWWNPLAYVISSRINAEREMACDEAVVLHTGEPRGYAQTLWRIALTHDSSGSPALAPGFAAESDVVSRFANLLAGPPPEAPRPAYVTLALGAFVGLLGISAVAVPVLAMPAQHIADYSSVTLSDGEVLIAGGRRADGSPVGTAQLYSARGALEKTFVLGVPRWSATSTLLKNGDVLITGGMTPHGPTNDALLYRQATRTLAEIAPMRFARAGQSATLVDDGDVVIASGERAPGTYVRQTEIYRAAQQRFDYVADGSEDVVRSAFSIGGGRVLMLLGSRGACTIIFDANRREYKDAGTLVRAAGSTLLFKQGNGRVISITIANASPEGG